MMFEFTYRKNEEWRKYGQQWELHVSIPLDSLYITDNTDSESLVLSYDLRDVQVLIPPTLKMTQTTAYTDTYYLTQPFTTHLASA